MIGWLKLIIISGALVVAGVVLWVSIMPMTQEVRSVSWYLANPAQRSADYAWCQEHPSVGTTPSKGPNCETVTRAKMVADANGFLRRD